MNSSDHTTTTRRFRFNRFPGDGLVVLIIVSLCCWPAEALWADTVTIDPSRTYLRTNLEQPGGSIAIELSQLQITAGDWIRLTQIGDFSYWATNTPDATTAMIGVFSGSSELLPHSELSRVKHAVDAGDDFVTLPTAFQFLPTDIGQDFRITNIIIQVPPGATHLFAAAHDSFYSDNIDPDGDFAVQIVVLACAPAADPQSDCNGNSLADDCEIAAGLVNDCNTNGVPDDCDIAAGTSSDVDGDGVPDECETTPCDLDGDGDVDSADLAALLVAWGPCQAACSAGDAAGTCAADFDGDCDVDAADLAILLVKWG